MMKWKMGIVLILLILFLPIVANAEAATLTGEVYSSRDVRALEEEGWHVSIVNLGSPYPWLTSERYGGMPTVNKAVKIEFNIGCSIYIEKEGIDINGPCEGERVYLDIYKGDVLVDDYFVNSDSRGIAEFTVTFREPGYYRYESYTGWEHDHGWSGTSNEFYVQSPALIDSDGDGIPDKFDYAPYDPNIQTESDIIPEATPTPKTPGFDVIFAIIGLLTTAYLLRRRR